MKTEGCIAISFLTQNRHKYAEAKEALSPYANIILEQLAEHKQENKDDSLSDPIKAIAIRAAEDASVKYNKFVVAEDSGVYFNAFDNFPGMNTKWIIKNIGYDGIMRLLAGKNRSAYFRAVIALSNPNSRTKVFEGRISGHISEKVYGENIDCMDYDRIFIPAGSDVPFALIMKNKQQISHRSIAFQKLGEYLARQED